MAMNRCFEGECARLGAVRPQVALHLRSPKGSGRASAPWRGGRRPRRSPCGNGHTDGIHSKVTSGARTEGGAHIGRGILTDQFSIKNGSPLAILTIFGHESKLALRVSASPGIPDMN